MLQHKKDMLQISAFIFHVLGVFSFLTASI